MTLIAALLLIAVVSTTKEGRDKAAERLRRYNVPMGVFAAIMWISLLAGAL